MDNRKKCTLCEKVFESESPAVLTMSGFGNARYICPECEENDNDSTHHYTDAHTVSETRYFSLEETEDSVLDMTLFSLGYPIGCYYEVESSIDGLTEECDLFSTDLTSSLTAASKSKIFALSDDRVFLMDK